MRFDEFNEALEPEHKAAIKGMHRLSGDQYYGLYKTMNDVAGHDGKKQTAPKGNSDDEVSDKPFAYAYTDEEEAMIKGADPKAKKITSSDSEELDEGALDKYRERVGTIGQSDRYRDSQERRHERNQEYDDARHQSRLNRLAADDQNYVAWRQNQSDRDAHRTTRMQKDDDDWDKTFDMMRDRINRYQWSSQRDVDPEQLAAISNIKYEPRKKTEAIQGNLMAVSPEYWQKAVLARYPNAQFRHQKMINGAIIAIDNNKEVGIYDPKTNYAKVGPTTEQGVTEAGRNYDDNRTGFARPQRNDDERHDLDVARPLIYGLKINGKIWQKDGNTVTFFTRERALAARNAILAKRPDVEVGLVQRPKD